MTKTNLGPRLALEPINWQDGSHSVSKEEALELLISLRGEGNYRYLVDGKYIIRDLFKAIIDEEGENSNGESVLGYVFQERNIFLYIGRGYGRLEEPVISENMSPVYRVILKFEDRKEK